MNIGSLFTPDAETLYQRERLADSTWEGAAVISMTGKLSEIYQTVPIFSRHPFRSGGEENRYKDEIRREPLKVDEEQIPVATVSKTYSLIQHRDVLASIYRALKLLNFECADFDSTLLMSEYGERILWSCQLPNFDFDPGDGHPLVLRMNCVNSVDMSTSLEVTLSWFRLVCSNGMMFGMGDSRMRKRHIRSLDPADVAEYIREQLSQAKEEQSLYREWLHHEVTLEQASDWVDMSVAREWGPHAAARVWHVMALGMDGEVQPVNDKRPPHRIELKSLSVVPGAPVPTGNLFHASQALSWVAGTRNSVQERIQYITAIPALIRPLAEASR
jgi:hypothetical protein